MAANSHVIDDINKMADEMVAMNHGQTKNVQKRRAEINSKSVVSCF
jgi:ABC-type molybdate transport system ATPase subunit